VGDSVLKGAGRMTTIATLQGGVKQSIRNHIASLVFGLAPVRHAMADAMTELSIGYPESPLTKQGGKVHDGPHAGQRAPIRADEPPVGAGNMPRFALFSESDENAAALLAQFPDFLEQKIRPPFQPGGLWLVRPDGYVAVATKQDDWERVSDFFKTLTVF